MSTEKSNDSSSQRKEQMTDRERMEVRLIALLLGEASDFEKAELEEAMDRDPGLRDFFARMENTIGVVREITDPEHAESSESYPRLSPARREELIRNVQPKERRVPVSVLSRRFSLRAIGLVASLVLGLGLFYLLLIRPSHDFRARKVYEVADARLFDLPEPPQPPQEEAEGRPYSSLAPSLNELALRRAPELEEMAKAVPFDRMNGSLNRSVTTLNQESGEAKRKAERLPESVITAAGTLQEVDFELSSLEAIELEAFDESASRIVGEDRESSSFATVRGVNGVTGPDVPVGGKAADLELFFRGGFRDLNESDGDARMAMGGGPIMRARNMGRFADVPGSSINAPFQFESPSADMSSDAADAGAAGHLSMARRVQAANRSRASMETETVGASSGKPAQPREPLQSPKWQMASAEATYAHDERQDLVELSESLEQYRGTAQTYRDQPKDMAETGNTKVVVNDGAKLPPAQVLAPLPEVQTADNPISTFSLNVSDVSFKLAAVALERGQLPEPGSIRSEEFINAFNYHDEAPTEREAIVFHWEYAYSPFAFNREVLRFSVQAAATGRSQSQPLNLAVALDNSGSMQRADRQAIVQELLTVLSSELREGDRVSLVAFDRTAHLLADGVTNGDRDQLLDQVRHMQPHGATHLESGLELAYAQAEKYYRSSANNRVILLTDGAANLGSTEADALSAKVEHHRRQGIALDSFGVGWDGYNDVLLEALSRRGDGRYGFINTVEEIRERFARKLAGSLRVAAADVKVQVEFNPDRVLSYRQVGYRRLPLRSDQFRDNTVDAAEIGAAEAGNALYVIETREDGRGPLGVVRIRYRRPDTGEVRERSWDLYPGRTPPALEDATPSMRLAVCAATFAEWLAGNPFADGVDIDQIRRYLAGVEDAYPLDREPARLALMLDQAAPLRR